MIHISRIALFSASALALAAAGSAPLLAAEATQKVLDENDKLQVIDVIEKPGDTGPITTRLGVVFYVVAGGTFERTYADGTKEVTPRKTGDVVLVKEKRPYSVKNIGTTTIHLIEILPKK
jgi:mannose-6-phosphate isomerase-like protein (cupin superfamily)